MLDLTGPKLCCVKSRRSFDNPSSRHNAIELCDGLNLSQFQFQRLNFLKLTSFYKKVRGNFNGNILPKTDVCEERDIWPAESVILQK